MESNSNMWLSEGNSGGFTGVLGPIPQYESTLCRKERVVDTNSKEGLSACTVGASVGVKGGV